MVHFGTTYDDTRALTIDSINKKAKDEFKNAECKRSIYFKNSYEKTLKLRE